MLALTNLLDNLGENPRDLRDAAPLKIFTSTGCL